MGNTPDLALGVDLALEGFEEHGRAFRSLTRRARAHFERRDWEEIGEDTVARLELHDRGVAGTLESLRASLGDLVRNRAFWKRLKEAYGRAILGRDDSELAQTFFNSLGRRALERTGLDPELDFVADDAPLPFRGWEMAAARTYGVHRIDAGVVEKILADANLSCPFRDLPGDAALAAERIAAGIRDAFGAEEIDALDVVRAPFFRSKGAYVVGRARSGDTAIPLLLALVHGDDGVAVDAVLTEEDDTSIVFSFARWYFHVDVEAPRQVIGFLASVLPRKRISELYISLGFHKHGKTEFYRDLTARIAATDDLFVTAPGEEGLVMKVFTLPSFEFVFKVIRDSFPATKSVTPRQVREKYRLVLAHDRVGRLVDFQEFEDLVIPRHRFAPELLDDLLRGASHRVALVDDDVLVGRVWVGRRVTPLDVFLAGDASDEEKRAAVLDWGACVKDLAAADIFSGDMLLKNFGVTRHDRVVFYDYDELTRITDCRFRRLPEPRHDFEALASEPWFPVRPGDVFPEEIPRFLELTGDLRRAFVEAHGDLFDPAFWRRTQERVREGEILDVFPYPSDRRLRPDRSPATASVT